MLSSTPTSIVQQLANRSSDMAICNHIDEKVYLQKMYPIQQIAKTIKTIKEFANTVLWYFSLQKSYPEQQFAKTRDNMMSFQKMVWHKNLPKEWSGTAFRKKSKGRHPYILVARYL